MTGSSTCREAIPSLDDPTRRPLWSVMIPTYNCARYLGETLRSVLAQDPGPDAMDIVVVDDASSDDPASVVEDLGRGRIQFCRQARNLGLHANLAACLRQSRGLLVHLLHGDDCVSPGFYAAMESGFADPAVGAAFCRWRVIDGNGAALSHAEAEAPFPGRLPDALAVLASGQRIVTPSIAVRRSVWEQLGGFDERLQSAEDWEMWVRIAAHHAIHYDPRVLASYRVHENSATARAMHNAREMRDTRRAMDLFAPLLPPHCQRQILRGAARLYAARCIERGRALNRAGRFADARAHACMALRFVTGPRTLRSAAAIFLRVS